MQNNIQIGCEHCYQMVDSDYYELAYELAYEACVICIETFNLQPMEDDYEN